MKVYEFNETLRKYDADDWDEETPYQLDEFGFKRSNDGSVVIKFVQQ